MVIKRGFLLGLGILLLCAGCSPSLDQVFLKKVDRSTELVSFFKELDLLVEKRKVRNVAVAKVEGFPYLRTDRFLVGLKNSISSASGLRTWTNRMQSLYLEAINSEIRALSLEDVGIFFEQNQIPSEPSYENLSNLVVSYANKAYQEDSSQAGFFDAVKAAATVEDDYSTLMRTFGFYPIAYLPVVYFSDKAFDAIRERFQLPVDQHKVLGELAVYKVEGHESKGSVRLSDLFNSDKVDALGIPTLTADEIKILAYLYAPVILQDTVEAYDRIGRFIWQEEAVQLDLNQPAVYYYVTYAFKNEQPVLQLNYAFWYTEREGDASPWFEKGELDGMTIRVSLDQKGEPFMVDIMNNCGCYHFYLPDYKVVKSVIEHDYALDAVVPGTTSTSIDEPLQVFINSGWHQVQYANNLPSPPKNNSYLLIPYEELESLPKGNGQTTNLFDEQGIMKNSYRIEPYIFFSMGIPKVGYMRQRGHHPVKMLGREHFDNPQLFNLNFVFY